MPFYSHECRIRPFLNYSQHAGTILPSLKQGSKVVPTCTVSYICWLHVLSGAEARLFAIDQLGFVANHRHYMCGQLPILSSLLKMTILLRS